MTAKRRPVHEGYKPSAKQNIARIAECGLMECLQLVCFEYHCTPLELCGPDKTVPLPEARGAFWWTLKNVKRLGLSRIAEICGVDRSTVLVSVRKRQETVDREEGSP